MKSLYFETSLKDLFKWSTSALGCVSSDDLPLVHCLGSIGGVECK